MTARERRPFYGWVIVAAVGLGQIISQGAGGYLFSLLLLPMQQTLGWSRAELSGAYSLSFLVLGLVLIPVGNLVDRRGARGVMAVGSILSASCLFGVALVRAPWQFYLLWGIGFGVGQALTSVQVGSTAIANWFVRRRGTALAYLAVAMGLTAPLFVPAASYLIFGVGWRWALELVAISFLLIPLPLSFLLLRHPEDVGLQPDGERKMVARPDSALDGSRFREAIVNPTLWVLSVSSILPAIAWGIVNTHQIAFMIGRGFDASLAAGVVGIAGFASLPGRFVLNAGADWLGAKRILIAVIALQAVGIAILMNANSALWLVCYSIVYGSTTGAAFGLRSKLIGDLFGRRSFGAIAAAHGTFIYIGGAVGPVAAGLMFDSFHSYQLAFTLAAIMTAVSVGGLLFVPGSSRAMSSMATSGGGP